MNSMTPAPTPNNLTGEIAAQRIHVRTVFDRLDGQHSHYAHHVSLQIRTNSDLAPPGLIEFAEEEWQGRKFHTITEASS